MQLPERIQKKILTWEVNWCKFPGFERTMQKLCDIQTCFRDWRVQAHLKNNKIKSYKQQERRNRRRA